MVSAQPLQNHILIATSTNSLDFQRQNIIFCDSGDVPDAVIGPDSQVYVYFQGLWTPTVDGIMVGISPDGLSNWQFHQVQIPGTGSWPGKPCDPDIILKNDTFRLYFTGDPYNDWRPETYSAISFDGIHFVLEPGVRFEIAGEPVLDPSLLWTGDTLQYFAGGAPPGENWHAHSQDGINFIQQPNFMAESLMLANGIAILGGYRFYGFRNMPPGGIRSLYSSDGENWTVDPGFRLEIDPTNGLESLYVKDPAVVFKDTVFIMYYVTRRPSTGIKELEQSPIKNFLFESSPNPFSNFTIITYQLQAVTKVSLKIYDAVGQKVRTLVDSPQSQGIYSVVWDGKDSSGKEVLTGIYFCQLNMGNFTRMKKLIRIR